MNEPTNERGKNVRKRRKKILWEQFNDAYNCISACTVQHVAVTGQCSTQAASCMHGTLLPVQLHACTDRHISSIYTMKHIGLQNAMRSTHKAPHFASIQCLYAALSQNEPAAIYRRKQRFSYLEYFNFSQNSKSIQKAFFRFSPFIDFCQLTLLSGVRCMRQVLAHARTHANALIQVSCLNFFRNNVRKQTQYSVARGIKEKKIVPLIKCHYNYLYAYKRFRTCVHQF